MDIRNLREKSILLLNQLFKPPKYLSVEYILQAQLRELKELHRELVGLRAEEKEEETFLKRPVLLKQAYEEELKNIELSNKKNIELSNKKNIELSSKKNIDLSSKNDNNSPLKIAFSQVAHKTIDLLKNPKENIFSDKLEKEENTLFLKNKLFTGLQNIDKKKNQEKEIGEKKLLLKREFIRQKNTELIREKERSIANEQKRDLKVIQIHRARSQKIIKHYKTLLADRLGEHRLAALFRCNIHELLFRPARLKLEFFEISMIRAAPPRCKAILQKLESWAIQYNVDNLEVRRLLREAGIL